MEKRRGGGRGEKERMNGVGERGEEDNSRGGDCR